MSYILVYINISQDISVYMLAYNSYKNKIQRRDKSKNSNYQIIFVF